MFTFRSVPSIVFTFCALSLPLAARADTMIFNLSPTNGSALTGGGLGRFGPAQGVIASTTTTISAFAFYVATYVATPATENLKFFIDSSTGEVLFSQVLALGANPNAEWLKTSALSFTLNAGSEYFFGLVGDQPFSTQFGFIFPTVPYSANGLAADSNGNRNAGPFANPKLGPLDGQTEIGLQLFQDTPVSVTPEPSSLILLGTGVLGVAGVLKRRLA